MFSNAHVCVRPPQGNGKEDTFYGRAKRRIWSQVFGCCLILAVNTVAMIMLLFTHVGWSTPVIPMGFHVRSVRAVIGLVDGCGTTVCACVPCIRNPSAHAFIDDVVQFTDGSNSRYASYMARSFGNGRSRKHALGCRSRVKPRQTSSTADNPPPPAVGRVAYICGRPSIIRPTSKQGGYFSPCWHCPPKATQPFPARQPRPYCSYLFVVLLRPRDKLPVRPPNCICGGGTTRRRRKADNVTPRHDYDFSTA